MNERQHQVIYEERFVQNLARYSSLRQRIRRRIEQILNDPYTRTERLRQVPGGFDLRGYRSARIDRNFRVIFLICQEYRQFQGRQYPRCEGQDDETVVFLTVGPHDRAYAMR